MTGRQMCEAIRAADFLRKANGTAPTAKEIWESSPSGELYQVFEWFEIAKVVNPSYFEEIEFDHLRGCDL